MKTLKCKANGCHSLGLVYSPDAKFTLGNAAITPAALEKLTGGEIFRAIARHSRGDWGNVHGEHRRHNTLALYTGQELLSMYQTDNGTRFFVVTDGSRTETTVLLPEEF